MNQKKARKFRIPIFSYAHHITRVYVELPFLFSILIFALFLSISCFFLLFYAWSFVRTLFCSIFLYSIIRFADFFLLFCRHILDYSAYTTTVPNKRYRQRQRQRQRQQQHQHIYIVSRTYLLFQKIILEPKKQRFNMLSIIFVLYMYDIWQCSIAEIERGRARERE